MSVSSKMSEQAVPTYVRRVSQRSAERLKVIAKSWHVVKHGLDLGLDWTCKLYGLDL